MTDDTLGVVWDVPRPGGGWISEAICWINDCPWKAQGEREAVERLLDEHLAASHPEERVASKEETREGQS